MTPGRPRAPSPRGDLALVQFTSGSGDEVWPSPDLSRIEDFSPVSASNSKRIQVFRLLGDLLDNGLLSEPETGILIDLILRGGELNGISDLLDARKTFLGKAQFLKIFLNVTSSSSSLIHHKPSPAGGFTTPVPHHDWQLSSTGGLYNLPPQTPFVEFPSSMIRSASPPLRFPAAQRPPPMKLSSIRENLLVRTASLEEDPKQSPESLKSTNAGSSVDETPSATPPAGTLTRDSSQTMPNISRASPENSQTSSTCCN